MEATEASTKCNPLKLLLYVYGLDPCETVVKKIIFDKVVGFTTANINHRYFSKNLTRDAEDLHFKIALCITTTFAKYRTRTTSKAKYDTTIDNSVECCSFNEKYLKFLGKELK